MSLYRTIRKILKEQTSGIDNFTITIKKKYNVSDELIEKIKEFIEESDCQKIEFANFKFMAAGLAVHDAVLINSNLLGQPLGYLLFVVFHEIAHQYQFKKYGKDEMYKCYIGDISIEEAADFLRRTEIVADKYGAMKVIQLQKSGLLKSNYKPVGQYKNKSNKDIENLVSMVRRMLSQNRVTSADQVSEYLYNMVKKDL
jgi:uncharacterized protein (DUF2132 family)